MAIRSNLPAKAKINQAYSQEWVLNFFLHQLDKDPIPEYILNFLQTTQKKYHATRHLKYNTENVYHYTICIHVPWFIDDELLFIADENVRTVEDQILYYIKCGLEQDRQKWSPEQKARFDQYWKFVDHG